jgi:predicted nucleotidyltransferase component of viral defense system
MPKSESTIPILHEDKGLFKEALNFTAAETGFLPQLIEKDYFCALALIHLSRWTTNLVFKGGTCLAKVHAGFYRLSEDLDFGISVPVDANRGERSSLISGTKAALGGLVKTSSVLKAKEALKGAANSTQYMGALEYESILDGHREAIKIEVSLREPFRRPVCELPASTLLLDPLSGANAIKAFPIKVIAYQEAMAEKVRAALSRQEQAIRDFYDLDHAVRNQGLELESPDFLVLVKEKLAVPGNGPVNLTKERVANLKAQVDPVLRPVLRERDFLSFDLNRIISRLAGAWGLDL